MAAAPHLGNPFALADAQFGGCQVVAKFIDDRVRGPVDAAANTSQLAGYAQGVLLRLIGWMRTVAKLSEPADFQAAASCARALFEMAVDLALLNGDQHKYPIEKLVAWQRSALLKHSMTVGRFLDGRKEAPPVGTSQMVQFVAREGASIQAEREKHWPPKSGKKPQHPARWTGRDLRADAADAERMFPRGFVEFYEIRYPQQCWHVHGSGMLAIGAVNTLQFPGIIALTFNEIALFATVGAEMAMRLATKWDAPTEKAFADLSKDREVAVALLFHQHPARQQSIEETESK